MAKPLKREYLRIIRKQNQLTCIEVAKALGLSHRQHYERYEKGERDFGADFFDKYFSVFSDIFSIKEEFLLQEEIKYLVAKYKNTDEFMTIKSFRTANPNATKRDFINETSCHHTIVDKFWELVTK